MWRERKYRREREKIKKRFNKRLAETYKKKKSNGGGIRKKEEKVQKLRKTKEKDIENKGNKREVIQGIWK